MTKIAERQINNKAEAMAFCNDLIGKFMPSATMRAEDIKPIVIKYSYRKQRSLNQNAWYFLWITDYIVPFWVENPLSLVKFMLDKVLKFQITTELVHELFKIVYNNGISTTKHDTKSMAEYCDKIRHDFLHDYQLHIPEPTIPGYTHVRE